MLVFELLLFIIADFTSKSQVVDIEPTSVTAFENESETFTCTTTVEDNWRSTRFSTLHDNEFIVSFVNNGGSCFRSSIKDPTLYNGTCGRMEGQFIVEILKIDDSLHNQALRCIVRYGTGTSNDMVIEKKAIIKILILTQSVFIKPTGVNNEVGVITGKNLTFTCTTDSSRPAAWIQWYIDGKNVTNHASSVTSPDDSKFISTSTLMYTGNNADHTTTIYCEAWNIEGRVKPRSTEIMLFIILPTTQITIEPTGNTDVVSVLAGSNFTFTCRTDLGRPAAWIQWYIGELNVTNQASVETEPDSADSTQFTTTSTLVYTGNDNDHDKYVHCEAVNSEKGEKIKTKNKVLYISVPVTTLNLSPVDDNKRLSVVSGEPTSLICRTNLVRPAARIYWYLGGQNETNDAIISTKQNGTDNTKFIYISSLLYTGRDIDHQQVVYCEAVNIEGRKKNESANLFIIFPVTNVIIEPAGDNDVVSLVSGTNINFTCTTGPARPSAWIQWYIGSQNVTNQAKLSLVSDSNDRSKSISTSTLVYIGKNTDHNTVIYCEAVNSEEGKKIKSENKTLHIIVPVQKVTFEHNGESDEIRIVKGQSHTFICTTNPGRPAAWIEWYIGELNMTNQTTLSQTPASADQTKFISTSTLVYTGRDADHNKSIHCKAGNTKAGKTVKTDDINLYIIVFITNITMTTDIGNDIVNVESDEKHVFTCTTDLGRPAAMIQWYIGGQNVTSQASLSTVHDGTDNTKYISTSIMVYYGNDADHDNVIHCEADNSEKGDTIKTENKTLYIIIPVTYVTFTQQDVGSSITVNSGASENFTCETDSSRPAAQIQWYISGQNVTNKASHKTQQNGTQFISSSSLTYIGNIRDHNQYILCNAFNIYERGRNISIRESFNIRSSPTAEVNQSLPDKIFVGTNEMLNLTFTIIANPSPNVTWTFTNTTTHGYGIRRTDFNITSVDIFRHVILYQKEQLLQKDFGNYTIEVVNNIKPTFVHTFEVEPAQAPSKPLSLDAECDQLTPRINVSWKSNFDGGKPQRFTVFLFNVFTDNMVKSQYILDKGQDAVHFFHSHELDYDSNYILYIEARNEYDKVNSSAFVNCTTPTKVSLEQVSSSAVIGGAAGSSAAIIALVFVAIVIIVRRRTKKKSDDSQCLNRLNESKIKQDEGDEDGLKDNPLYGTSKSSAEADVYSQVKKKPQKMKESTVKSNNRIKKQWQNKGHQTRRIELDVYENSEDLGKGLNKNVYGNVTDHIRSAVMFPSSGYKIKRNKDGLIYADLEFAPTESGKKLFVIGSENKTNYAMIDLTMHADPLPDNSDEDVKNDPE